MKNKIVEYQILDHGIDHSQYFQGCGTSFTDYDNVVTGCGFSAKEAFNDALEQIASNGDIDFDIIEKENSEFNSEKAEEANVENYLKKQGEELEENEECELYYYLSIRYNVEEIEEVKT